MKPYYLCQKHEEQLKHELQAVGLGDFVTADQEHFNHCVKAATVHFLLATPLAIEEYDAYLMAVTHLMNNATAYLLDQECNPLILMSECPVCFLNKAAHKHSLHCTNPACNLKDDYYDNWISFAARDQVTFLEKYVAKKTV